MIQRVAKIKLNVHGGIRHLEITAQGCAAGIVVHGGIRHLEIHVIYSYEPFRNVTVLIGICSVCSLRNLF